MSTRSLTWRPTTTSTAIALATAVTVVAALLWQVDDVLLPVALGVVGAALFPLGCWLLAHDRLGTAARPVVSLLTPLVGLGLFGSSAGIALVLSARYFPVEDGSLVSVMTLLVAGHVGVVLGSVLALLGVALGLRNVVTAEVLGDYTATALLTAIVPGGIAAALATEALVFEAGGPLRFLGEFATIVWVWLTAGELAQLPVAGFLFVLALALTSVLAAVLALPVAELLVDHDERAARRRVRRWRRDLTVAAGGVLVLVLAAFWVEFQGAALADAVGPAYTVPASVASVRLFRFVLLGVAAIALAATLGALLTRRLARQSTGTLARTAGPLAGGAVITLAAALVADPVYDALLGVVLEPLPPETAGEIEELGVEAATFYGTETFVILLAFALVAAPLCFVLVLRAVLFFGYVSAETPGFSLASAGVFLAVAAAGTIGAPAWLVLGGVLATLLVWDAGRYGTTMGREMRAGGSGPATRGTELVHAGGTLLVGLTGTLAALVLASRVDTTLTTPGGTTSVAFVAVTVGVVCFVVALR